ncbi:MAG: molybdopterin-dependent oxidoreductase [Candidatus Bipolaricaulia bacterium]
MLTTKISRRGFLKATGFATAAALMGGMLKDGSVWAFQEAPVLKEELKEIIPSACWIGKQDCGLFAWKAEGRVIKFEGHPDEPRTHGALCPKGQSQIASLYDPYRVKAPLKRTNPKGQPGQWIEISWDQALSEIAAKLKEIKETDIRRFIWQVGRKKAKYWHHEAFNKAFGTVNKYGHGATCSDAGYRAEELIFDQHGCAEVDFKHCEYFLAWGWNITQAGGPHLCQITWPQQIIEAKRRGMKIVALDPLIRGGAHLVDEWVSIKPGMDLAFWLAMANVLVEKGYLDEPYLKKFTNAPVLVGPDGLLLIQDGKELVWDPAAGQAWPHEEVADPALTGTYAINGVEYKTAFQLYQEHIAKYTPEWAAEKCGVAAEKIRQIATEFGEKAQIGKTITIEGVEVPYRPVGIGFYHVVQQELGAIVAYAAFQVTMLVGAVDVAGSTRPRKGKDTKPDVKHRKKWIDLAMHPEKVKEIPDGPSLDGTKFFPISSGGYTITPLVLANPEKYDLPYQPEQMAMWVQMANPVMSSMPQDVVIRGLSRLGLMVVVDPFMSETADYCADYVLPAATIDKYEGPLSGFTGYEKVSLLRFPVVPPMFDSKPDAEIYIEMAEQLGILEQYVEALNGQLKLKEELKLDPAQKPSLEDALDRWAKSQGKSLQWFREHGVLVKSMPVQQWYAYLWDPPYGGVKHAFYSEVLLRLGRTVRERGVNAPYVQDYNPFPTWRKPAMMQSPPEYDLTLISFHKIEHKQSRTANNVILNAMDPISYVRLHPETARAKGIRDGDEVWVESHNAVTGETRRVKGRAKLTEGLMPGVMAIAHHHGNWSHPITKERDQGISPNVIFPSGEGYVGLTGDQAFQVKVKVSKA